MESNNNNNFKKRKIHDLLEQIVSRLDVMIEIIKKNKYSDDNYEDSFISSSSSSSTPPTPTPTPPTPPTKDKYH